MLLKMKKENSHVLLLLNMDNQEAPAALIWGVQPIACKRVECGGGCLMVVVVGGVQR